MKKIFKSLVVLLTVLATGFSTSSCSEDWQNLLAGLAQVNGGSETTFVGKAKITKYYTNAQGNWEYDETKGVVTTNSYSATVKVEGKSAIQEIIGSLVQGGQTQNSISIDLGNITVDNITLTNVSLTAVAYDKTTNEIGDVKDEGYAYSCSYTMNGKTYTTPSDFSTTPYAIVSGKIASVNETTCALTLNVELDIDDNTAVGIEIANAAQK